MVYFTSVGCVGSEFDIGSANKSAIRSVNIDKASINWTKTGTDCISKQKWRPISAGLFGHKVCQRACKLAK